MCFNTTKFHYNNFITHTIPLYWHFTVPFINSSLTKYTDLQDQIHSWLSFLLFYF
jgi:hypothetical protein